MKKQEFKKVGKTLIDGDVLIVKIRPHQFMLSRENSFSPFVHCVFVRVSEFALEVHFEGTVSEGSEFLNGANSDKPHKINYARIESIEKL